MKRTEKGYKIGWDLFFEKILLTALETREFMNPGLSPTEHKEMAECQTKIKRLEKLEEIEEQKYAEMVRNGRKEIH